MKITYLIHYLEIPATLAGILNVYLAARTNIWNYLFGIIMVSLYMVIFFDAKLYADMCLQFIFFSLQFYGIYQWLHGGKNHTHLNITQANKKIWWIAVIATLLLFFSIAYVLARYTDSNSVYIDAFTTALSIVAQWMLSKKWLENWLLWIIVDIISIKMYIFKNLYLTAGLYLLFLIICCIGYYQWRKSLILSPPAQLPC